MGAVSTLASLSLAFSVAYSLLDPFHFRGRIEKYSQRALDDLDFDKGALHPYGDREYCLQLMFLSGNQDRSGKVKMPKLLKGIIKGVDRFVSTIIAGLSLCAVVTIACLQSFTEEDIFLSMEVSILLCSMLSVFLVGVTCMGFLGSRAIRQARELADKCKVELVGYMGPSDEISRPTVNVTVRAE